MPRRALLLTDVVDSTTLSEVLGDVRMAEVWAAHDRVARDLLVVHDGREIDKTDGFLMLFEDARQAVEYAIAYHRAVGALDPPLRARAGLHVGDVILTENAPADVARGAKLLEVDGIAKPTAARVMSVAAAGQTLLTSAARDALGGSRLRVASHGHWRMKGLAEPLELFEVGDDAAPFQPPPDGGKVYRVVARDGLWLPVGEVRHSLPAERDAFVGRSADLQALATALDGARLVSVLGTGGSGKTRLVTRFGWTWLGDWPGGVWFCDLSESRSADGIVSAVARALVVRLGADDPVTQLGHAIAGRGRCLVVLDNFEQVARHASATLGAWLDRAQEASFVVTTREVLGLPGETAVPLAPLVADESVALFVARARQAKPAFAVADADVIHALVALLDGLPLAIELAAARVRLMPPRTLLKRMSQRFRLLASRGGRHTRQATLRATLDWSWELLSADEQSALAQLSVFEGGFTLQAAEGVLELDALWPVDAVQALLDKSLVRQVSEDRFDLLVSVQEYAAEKLEHGGGGVGAKVRHGAVFAELGADDAVEALIRHGGVALRRALARELDNVSAACRRAVVRGDEAVAAGTLEAAWEVLALRGPFAVAVDLAEGVLGLALSPGHRARAHQICAVAHYAGHRIDAARAHCALSLTAYRGVGDRRGEGRGLASLGAFDGAEGRTDAARAHFEAALPIHREVGDRGTEALTLDNLGLLSLRRGQMDAARARFEDVLRLSRDLGDRGREGRALEHLGQVHLRQGRMDEALARFTEALAMQREVRHRPNEGIVLGHLGALHAIQGHRDAARACFEGALAVHREVGNRRREGSVLANLGMLYYEEGLPDAAQAHLAGALVVSREIGSRRTEGIVHKNLGLLHLEQGRLDAAREAFAASETLLRAVAQPEGLGLLLCHRVRLEAAQGEVEAARGLLAEATSLAEGIGAGPDSQLRKKLTEARAVLLANDAQG